MSYGSSLVVCTDHEGVLNGARLFLSMSRDVHGEVKVSVSIPTPVCMPDSGVPLPRPHQFHPMCSYAICISHLPIFNGYFLFTAHCTSAVSYLPSATSNISEFISYIFTLLNRAGGLCHLLPLTSKDNKGPDWDLRKRAHELREPAQRGSTRTNTKGDGTLPQPTSPFATSWFRAWFRFPFKPFFGASKWLEKLYKYQNISFAGRITTATHLCTQVSAYACQRPGCKEDGALRVSRHPLFCSTGLIPAESTFASNGSLLSPSRVNSWRQPPTHILHAISVPSKPTQPSSLGPSDYQQYTPCRSPISPSFSCHSDSNSISTSSTSPLTALLQPSSTSPHRRASSNGPPPSPPIHDEAPSSSIQLLASCPAGGTITITISLSSLISDLKKLIHSKTKIPPSSQVVCHQSKCLDDHLTIDQCGLRSFSSIVIRLRLRGGQLTGTLEDWLQPRDPKAKPPTRSQHHHFPARVWAQPPRPSNNSRSQQRSASHRAANKSKAKTALHRGFAQYSSTFTPALRHLLNSNRAATDDDQQADIENAINVTAEQLAQARAEEEVEVNKMLEQWVQGAAGYVPSVKPDNSIRGMGENCNSLRWFEHKYCKVPKLIRQLRHYDVDQLHLLETQVNFDSSQVKPTDGRLQDKIGVGKERKCIAANNMHNDCRSCPGGLAQMTFGPLSSYVLSQGADETGLARWVWTKVGMRGGKTTTFISGYQPCDNKSSRGTVLSQQSRYFEALGDHRNPRTIFFEDILHFIASCRANNEEVILFIDANEHIYNGRLGKALSGEEFNMKEQFFTVTGKHAPASHADGSRPITGLFATAGIQFLNIFQSAHKSGIGDHRYTVYDVDATSVLGVPLRHVQRPATRLLRMEVERNVERFNKCLEQLVDQHRMFRKLSAIHDLSKVAPEVTVKTAFNKWDQQLEEFIHCSEKKGCGKVFSGAFDSSPIFSFWLRRVRLWRKVKQHKLKPFPDPRNLYRDLKAQGYPKPREMSMEVIEAKLMALEEKLEEQKQKADQLRKDHLTRRLDIAKERGDTEAIKAIKRIIKKERKKKAWSLGRSVYGKPRGKAVLAVEVKDDNGIAQSYSTQAEIEQQAVNELDPRFRLSESAPIFTSPLIDHVGPLGENPAVKEILNGTFVYPDGCDKWTIAIMKAACDVFQHMSPEEISNLVTQEDFQEYWLHAREITSSSYSNMHFGIYMANARSDKLSFLHAAKLSLAAKLGITLDRWHNALTVLLEKTFGCILINKLRAICLLEADYNWLMKLIFAKRMMDNALSRGVVPAEQFAKKGSRPQDGCMIKLFHYDRARVLHHTAAIESVDLHSCYDSVAHPVASIALQAFSISIMMIKVMLSALQTMKFFLRTGFGDSKSFFGGTDSSPYGGLGQGNGAAPPAFTAVSTLLIMAFVAMGHGNEVECAITGFCFSIAAIMYVDDTDLLTWARSSCASDEEFRQQVQDAVTDWTKLVLATGGALRPDKCFWYWIAFRFKNGIPYYRSLRELPKEPILVPMRDGSLEPIELKQFDDATVTLGVPQCPAGTPDAQLSKMKQHGFDWADKASTTPLPRYVNRMCHDHMLVPRMKYGIECLLATPSELSAEMRKVMYRCLPYLGVNRNYKTEFCTLPRLFHGLELVDWPVEKLVADVHIMMQHWSSPDILGCCLRSAYELLQMETGLEGNIFAQSYRDFGCLATHSWMAILWQYLDHLGVTLELSSTYFVQPVREGDSGIIQLLFSNGWRGPRLVGLNRYRKHKKVHRVSCLVMADGYTFHHFVHTKDRGSSSRVWSYEEPTTSDYRLWQQAIRVIAHGRQRLPQPLGRFVGSPHIHNEWTCNEDRDRLCRRLSNGSFAIYTLSHPCRFTRSGLPFEFHHYDQSDPLLSLTASVLDDPSPTIIRLHSAAPIPSLTNPPVSFLAVLASWENQSLWRNLKVDDDGLWLSNAILANSLLIVHDGSYMKKVTTRACSMALIMKCRITGRELTCTWVEVSDSADNYRGEWLGALASSLILKAISYTPTVYNRLPVERNCDNMGVVKHGNNLYGVLKDGQAQADVIRLTKSLDRDLPLQYRYKWVQSHTDDKRKQIRRPLTDIEMANNRADSLCKTALIDGLLHRDFISSDFPFEPIRIRAGNSKLTGPLRPFLRAHHGKRIARQVFGFGKRGKKLLKEEDFDLVYWDVIPRALKEFPDTFRDWLSKHVTGCCGVNRFLSKWKEGVTNHCPCCKRHNEDILHLTTCQDVGRTTIFNEMVDKLGDWLDNNHTPEDLTFFICKYLKGRDRLLMTNIIPHNHKYHALAIAHDRLGWRSFLEGRISTILVQEMHYHLASTPSLIGAADWAKGLVNHLIRITHRQWKYRNDVNNYTVEGRTPAQHKEILAEMERLMSVDPRTLLPKYRHLYEDEDFEELGSGSATNRVYWIASAKSAIAASALHRASRGKRRRETAQSRDQQTSSDSPQPSPATDIPPCLPTEHGLKYKKRRLK